VNVNRRQFLAVAAAGTVSALLSGCRSLEQMAFPVTFRPDFSVGRPKMSFEDAGRVLGRIGYGHRPGDRSALQLLGLSAFVEMQLLPMTIPESDTLAFRLGALSDQIPNDYGLLFEQDDHALINSLAQAAALQATYSNRSLLERMAEFWTDHFNVFAFKSLDLPQYIALMQLNVLRQHSLGRFRDLLGAAAHSAAILSYLDNDKNRAGAPNENFAREIMELHTLGIHGGYTQEDVRNVARCLTGWTVNTLFNPGSFQFDESLHDHTRKVVFGREVSCTGEQEMESILDQLAEHPATANHIAAKLLMRFRGDIQPDHLDHVATVFLASSGDMKNVLRAIFLECGVIDAPPILKRPFDYVVSSLRALDADSDCRDGIVSAIAKMGQPLFQWPRPDGFPDNSRSWSNCFSPRWQFAIDLTSGEITNTSINWTAKQNDERKSSILDTLLSLPANDEGRIKLEAITEQLSSLQECAALGLMSPAFQWR